MSTFYWYQSFDHSYHNRGYQKISLLLNRLLGENENNAFVRLTISTSEESELLAAEKEMEQFLEQLHPVLLDFML